VSFLSAADLAELRAVQELAFQDTCTVRTARANADGNSGYTHDWTTETTVACGVSSPSRATQTGLPILDTGSDERQMVFSLPVDTAISQGDRLVWNGRVFEITSLEEPGTFAMQLTAIGLERAE
jgi:hypothetical protein